MRRLLLLAVPALAALGLALPGAHASIACLSAHVNVNGTDVVNQTICDDTPPPALP